MTVEQQLESMGLSLPRVAKPIASYVPAVRTGNLVFCSGQLPIEQGALKWRGRVIEEVSEDDAFVWNAWIRDTGFAPAQRAPKPHDEEQGPRVMLADREGSLVAGMRAAPPAGGLPPGLAPGIESSAQSLGKEIHSERAFVLEGYRQEISGGEGGRKRGRIRGTEDA